MRVSFLFLDTLSSYNGGRTADDIVNFVNEKAGK